MSSADPFLFGSPERREALAREADWFVSRASTMVRRARALVVGERRDACELLARRRAALMVLLGRYQRFKHGRIFDPVIAHGSSSARIVARGMKVECVVMGEEFGNYHTRWLGADLCADWATYRDEMIGNVDRLLLHLAAEQRAIDQLLMIAAMNAPGNGMNAPRLRAVA